MCKKCGCNTCESIRGPLLTEGRVKKLVSENLQYHINENIPLMESVFRIGSDAHLSLIKEARKLYSRGVLDLCEEDEGIMETHLGEFDLYEDEIVPLDLPMVNEEIRFIRPSENIVILKGDSGEYTGYVDDGVVSFSVSYEDREDKIDDFYNESNIDEFLGKDHAFMELAKKYNHKWNIGPDYVEIEIDFKNLSEFQNLKEDRKEELLTQIRDALLDIMRGDSEREKDIEDLDVSIDAVTAALTGKSPIDVAYDQDLFGRFAKNKSKDKVKEAVVQALTERKKKKKKTKKDPPIGKPKRGGPKAYYVYVRDPKTKRIKKVTFGSGGLRAKIRNPKARNAFAKRHRCSEKNDRTKASYWSCRLPRYASQLGLGANMNTFW